MIKPDAAYAYWWIKIRRKYGKCYYKMMYLVLEPKKLILEFLHNAWHIKLLSLLSKQKINFHKNNSCDINFIVYLKPLLSFVKCKWFYWSEKISLPRHIFESLRWLLFPLVFWSVQYVTRGRNWYNFISASLKFMKFNIEMFIIYHKVPQIFLI